MRRGRKRWLCTEVGRAGAQVHQPRPALRCLSEQQERHGRTFVLSVSHCQGKLVTFVLSVSRCQGKLYMFFSLGPTYHPKIILEPQFREDTSSI